MGLNRTPEPPKWIGKLLAYFLNGPLLEMTLGDLQEQFNCNVAEMPSWKAKLHYIVEGLRLLRLWTFQKTHKNKPNIMDMLKNYFIISIRKMRKERTYTGLNIAGLAIGIASFLVIYAYIQFEQSYDKFHPEYDHIYRITEEYEDDAKRVKSAMSHSPVAEILFENLASIKGTVRILPYPAFVSSGIDKKYKEDTFCFADSLFFDIFSFKPIAGSLGTALDHPHSVVLTASTARKYFGETDVVGKQVLLEDESQVAPFTVTALIEDVPQNSHFNFNFIASISSLKELMPWHNNWQYPPMYVYLQTTSSMDLNGPMIQAVIEKHQPDEIKHEKRIFDVQPIDRIHLHSNLNFEWQKNSDFRYVSMFGVMAVLILVMACINFTNLATAQAAKRAREVGVRKTMGSQKLQLVGQFLSETLLFVLFATIVGLVIAEVAGKWLLLEIIKKDISIASLLRWPNSLFMMAFILAVVLLAGLYPAFFLSSIPSASVIKGSTHVHNGRAWSLRKALVVFQVGVSGLLIFTSAVVYWQVDFFKNVNLGFDKDQIVNVQLSDRFAQKNYQILKDQLLNQTNVLNVALSSALPGQGSYHGLAVKPEGASSNTEIMMKSLGVDEDFVSTYGVTVLQGRDFSKEIASDQTDAFILNTAAARKLGWADPIGKEFELTVYIRGPVRRKGKIIGLIEDFHYQSLHNQIEPLVIYINKHPYYAEYLSVKLKPGNLAESISMLQKEWKTFHPEKPLELQFLDSELGNLYSAEIKLSQLFSTLMVIAITISILGLFGLSSYTASKRWKEMSIRKIFGATEGQVMSHLLKEYLYIVIVANLLAFPICWYWSTNWLENFPYHISLNWVWLIFPLTASIIITVITVSFHSLKVARSNPAEAVKSE